MPRGLVRDVQIDRTIMLVMGCPCSEISSVSLHAYTWRRFWGT